jgi:hypothetical protein
MLRALRSPVFWLPFLLTLLLAGAFFAWELGAFQRILPSLPRATPTPLELGFTALLLFLLAFNAGLVTWQTKNGTCPIGVKRATGAGGIIGTVALLCPVCLLLPASFLGLSALMAFLVPFLPLLRFIALVLLLAALYLLWPNAKK